MTNYIVTEYTNSKGKTKQFSDAQIYVQSEMLCQQLNQQYTYTKQQREAKVNLLGQLLDKISLVSFLSGIVFLFVDFSHIDVTVGFIALIFAFAVSFLISLAGHSSQIEVDTETQLLANYGELKSICHFISLLPTIWLCTMFLI